MLWAYGSFVGGRLLVLGATVVLARLLTPAEFGLVALALIFITLLERASDLGVTQALIVADERDVEARAETAFVVAVGLGAALSFVTAAIAPLAADFFDDERLVALLPLLGLVFLLRALGITHYALAQKRIDFRSRTAAEIADAVVRGGTGIALAFAGFGAYSLVIGYLVGSAVLSVTMWLLVPWRPSLRPKREHLRQLLGFGGAVSAHSLVSAVIGNVDRIIIGRVLGATPLGLYTIAFRLPDLAILNISYVAGNVLFPAFAALDRADLGRAFLTSLRYTVMLALPIAVGLAALAEPVLVIVFGDQWTPAAPTMQLIVVYSLGLTLSFPGGTAFKAISRTGLLLGLALVRAALVIASLLVLVDQGIAAAAACQAVVAVAFGVIDLGLASRLLGVRVRDIVGAIAQPVVAVAVMSLVVVPAALLLEAPLAAVLVASIMGALVYGVALWQLMPAALSDLRRLVVPASQRPPG